MDKANLVGYAICHRIPSHSLSIAGRSLPLCARCTGIFTGSLATFCYFMIKRRRVGELAPVHVLLMLLGFSFLMGIDGINSYITLLPIGSPLYEPTNGLRLLTGMFHGITLASIVYPLAMSTFWKNYVVEPVIKDFRDLTRLAGMIVILTGLIWTKWPMILYAVGVFSVVGVVLMFTMILTVMLLVLGQRENRAVELKDLLLPITMALVLSLIMLGVIDYVRFSLTGTLSGIPGLEG